MRRSSCALLVVLLLALVAQVAAQAIVFGRLVGHVSDAQGAPVPGATISVISARGTKTFTTDSEGRFFAPFLEPGRYTVLAELTGFSPTQVRDVEVVAGGEATLQLVLKVGGVEEVVEVVGAAPIVTSRLPVGRGFTSTLYLTPGVSDGHAAPWVAPSAAGNTESYARIDENAFVSPAQHPLSTFSIDVDTASYANVRRFVEDGERPPTDAVRIEELVNYFDYRYPAPSGPHPLSVATEIGDCPWAPAHRLARVGLAGRSLKVEAIPPRNLVFLIDVSGSMQPENKLPLVKQALRVLVPQLGPRDRIALVVYAGSSGLVLDATPGDRQAEVLGALDRLEAGGSTHGAAGIRLAYEVAVRNFVPGGVNRVVLCTDGDFNVGVTDEGELTRLIEEKRATGVFLSVLGFGMGNLKDSTLEKLADRGNGNYAYIDSLAEARRVLGADAAGTLVTVARDVKLQVEFNPRRVAAYRLIGYENRALRDEDFEDDTKDAGELGAGQTVTALYEIVPAGAASPARPPLALRYQQDRKDSGRARSEEWMAVSVRYQPPGGGASRLLTTTVRPGRDPGSADLRFAAAVAAFGMLLRDSPHRGEASFEQVLWLAREAKGPDPQGLRAGFVALVERARELPAREREARR